MTIRGVTSAGFVTYPASDIKTDMDSALKANILGTAAGSEPDGSIPAASNAGQLVSILTDGFSALWDGLEAVNSGQDPNAAIGASQDALCALNGVTRAAAAFSTVAGACVGVTGTVLPTGRVATVTSALTRFATTAPFTIATVSAWANGHAYSLGDRCKNGSTARVYQCITAGTSAGSGGPTTTALDITDNTCHWRYLGDGDGAVDATFQAEQYGALAAFAWSLATIATPVSGWNAVSNPTDATLGALQESDSDLRVRREQELAGQASSAQDAIRTALLRVGQGTNYPVLSCTVYHNDTDGTVGTMTPHSVECLVQGGIDAAIAAAIAATVAAGIVTIGTTTVNVTDSQGHVHAVKFSRPVAVTIWLDLAVTYDPLLFPTDLAAGEAAIKDALALFCDAYPPGRSVRASALEAATFDSPSTVGGDAVAGILDVTALNIGTSYPATVPTTIPITPRQIADFDTTRIAVTLTAGTPGAP